MLHNQTYQSSKNLLKPPPHSAKHKKNKKQCMALKWLTPPPPKKKKKNWLGRPPFPATAQHDCNRVPTHPVPTSTGPHTCLCTPPGQVKHTAMKSWTVQLLYTSFRLVCQEPFLKLKFPHQALSVKLTTRTRRPIAREGRFFLNCARTAPLLPWGRVIFPQMTRRRLGLSCPGQAVFL